MRTYGVKQEFGFVEGFGYIERVVQSDIFFRKSPIFLSYVRIVKWATILYKHHWLYISFLRDEYVTWTRFVEIVIMKIDAYIILSLFGMVA